MGAGGTEAGRQDPGRQDAGKQTADWSLDPRLAADGAAIAELTLCRVLLVEDANFPWLILVPRRPGAVELIDLDTADQHLLMDEIAVASRAFKRATSCDKLNVAALGNAVAQLHIHVVARFRGDAAGLRPIWGLEPPPPPLPWVPEERAALVAAIRAGIASA